jgi:sugar-specific transcriptional regulator TrmB
MNRAGERALGPRPSVGRTSDNRGSLDSDRRAAQSREDATFSRALRHVGLTNHESQLYHALVRQGPTTAREAIAESGLDRATGYRMLSRLRARGMLSVHGFRPQQFIALDVGRLLERVVEVHRDEIEIRRLLRQAYASGFDPASPDARVTNGASVPSISQTTRAVLSGGPGLANGPLPLTLLPTPDSINRYVVERLGEAKKEICALVRPRSLSKSLRTELIRTMVGRLKEGVPIRLVFDYHPSEIEFLTEILRLHPDALGTLMVRFYALQFARLFAVDQRVAVRWLASPSGTNRDPELGVASDHGEFVRSQMTRFENTWRAGISIEQALSSPRGSIIAPTACSRELRLAIDAYLRRRGAPSSGPLAPDDRGVLSPQLRL